MSARNYGPGHWLWVVSFLAGTPHWLCTQQTHAASHISPQPPVSPIVQLQGSVSVASADSHLAASCNASRCTPNLPAPDRHSALSIRTNIIAADSSQQPARSTQPTQALKATAPLKSPRSQRSWWPVGRPKNNANACPVAVADRRSPHKAHPAQPTSPPAARHPGSVCHLATYCQAADLAVPDSS